METRFTPAAAIVAIGLLVSAAGCSDRTSRSFVFDPEPGAHALTGRVRVASDLTNAIGQPAGTRVLEDASGVRVRLWRPDGAIDSTLTRDGIFEFPVNAHGFYRAFCCIAPADTAARSDLALETDSATFPDTLKIGSSPDLATHPNPFTTGGLAIEFVANASQRAELFVLSISCVPVWSYSADIAAGYVHIHWPGLDDHGDPVPAGPYWVVARWDGRTAHDLVFKE